MVQIIPQDLQPLALVPTVPVPVLTLLGKLVARQPRQSKEVTLAGGPPLGSVPPEGHSALPKSLPCPWLEVALRAELKAERRPTPEEAGEQILPKLIIGFGEAGQWVLTHIKNRLLDRMDVWPNNVKLLLIDFQDAGVDPRKRQIHFAGRSLDETEIILLRPQFRQVEAQIEPELRQREQRWTSSDRSHLYEEWHHRWWLGNRPEQYGRCGGRMAVFWDLQGREGGGELERRLREALDLFKESVSFEAFLVASAADERCSGMIWDVGHLLRVLPQACLPNAISLFLAFSPTARESNAHQIAAAVLRELNRLSYSRVTPHHYLKGVPSERSWLVSAGEEPPFDRCYLLGDKSGQECIDLSEAPPEYGLLALTADVITALLDRDLGTQFALESKNFWKQAHFTQQGKRRCVVSSMGAFTFKVPVRDLRRALEYRLLLDLLYGEGDVVDPAAGNSGSLHREEAIGVLQLQAPAGGIGATASLWHRPVQDDTRRWEEEVDNFLRGHDEVNLLRRQSLLAATADAWREGAWPQPPDPELWNHSAIAGAGIVMRSNLQQKLTILLNGEPDANDVVNDRSARFPDALAFLRTLRDVLETGVPPLPSARKWPLDETLLVTYDEFLADSVQMTMQAQEELEAWVGALAPDVALEESSTPSGHRLELVSLSLGSQDAAGPPTLRDLLTDGFRKVRRHLEEERQVLMRETFLEPEQLDLPFYLGSKRRHHIAQTMRQLVWRWEFGAEGSPSLRLMILGPQHMNITQDQWQACARSSQETALLVNDLLDLARAISRSMIEDVRLETLMREAVWPRHPNVAEALRGKLLTMIGMPRAGGQMETRRYAAAGSWPGGREWQPSWGPPPGSTAMGGAGGDRFSSTVLDVLKPIFLDSTDVWLRSVGEIQDVGSTWLAPYYPSPWWHVLPAEQVAAECEARHVGGLGNVAEQLFHPLFVSLLADEDLACGFGLGYLVGLVQRRGREQTYYWTPNGQPLEGRPGGLPPVLQAMQAFTVLVPWTAKDGEQLVGWQRRDVLNELDAQIGEEWKRLEADHESLDQLVETLHKERIAPLDDSHNVLERNLARFLTDLVMRYRPY